MRHPVVYEERPYMVEGGGGKRLNETWVEHTDPHTGKKYYTNLRTKTTTWIYPREVPPHSH